jgi:hypothetical protein
MTVTFENDNDVIVYALEKVIAYARRTQQVFVAHCVWWLASVIGLESGLVNHIDNLRIQEEARSRDLLSEEVQRVSRERAISTVPRDLTEDQRLDLILDSADKVIQESFRDLTIVQ